VANELSRVAVQFGRSGRFFARCLHQVAFDVTERNFRVMAPHPSGQAIYDACFLRIDNIDGLLLAGLVLDAQASSQRPL
jgi:hypothetical protein